VVRKGGVDLLSDGDCWLRMEEAGALKLVNPNPNPEPYPEP